MKKIYTLLLFVLFISTAGYSQVATGLRARVDDDSFGGVEFSVQSIGDYEFDLGWNRYNNWQLTGIKQVSFYNHEQQFDFYVGGGASLGVVSSIFKADLVLNIGTTVEFLRYFQLGLDYRPEFRITDISTERFNWKNVGLSFRVLFY